MRRRASHRSRNLSGRFARKATGSKCCRPINSERSAPGKAAQLARANHAEQEAPLGRLTANRKGKRRAIFP